jgi:hypothetical protein
MFPKSGAPVETDANFQSLTWPTLHIPLIDFPLREIPHFWSLLSFIFQNPRYTTLARFPIYLKKIIAIRTKNRMILVVHKLPQKSPEE